MRAFTTPLHSVGWSNPAPSPQCGRTVVSMNDRRQSTPCPNVHATHKTVRQAFVPCACSAAPSHTHTQDCSAVIIWVSVFTLINNQRGQLSAGATRRLWGSRCVKGSGRTLGDTHRPAFAALRRPHKGVMTVNGHAFLNAARRYIRWEL